MKLDELKFGLAGGIISLIFVLVFEIFLWIKYVPLYNSMMINLYGVAGFSTFGLMKILLVSVFLGFIIGSLLTWLFAWIYNKLLLVNVK
jgi:hypothetical protein|tara:strand:- start:292 stop:558 length:267 start_codon:yes stop_codon:yes gene_type:complete